MDIVHHHPFIQFLVSLIVFLDYFRWHHANGRCLNFGEVLPPSEFLQPPSTEEAQKYLTSRVSISKSPTSAGTSGDGFLKRCSKSLKKLCPPSQKFQGTQKLQPFSSDVFVVQEREGIEIQNPPKRTRPKKNMRTFLFESWKWIKSLCKRILRCFEVDERYNSRSNKPSSSQEAKTSRELNDSHTMKPLDEKNNEEKSNEQKNNANYTIFEWLVSIKEWLLEPFAAYFSETTETSSEGGSSAKDTSSDFSHDSSGMAMNLQGEVSSENVALQIIPDGVTGEQVKKLQKEVFELAQVDP